MGGTATGMQLLLLPLHRRRHPAPAQPYRMFTQPSHHCTATLPPVQLRRLGVHHDLLCVLDAARDQGRARGERARPVCPPLGLEEGEGGAACRVLAVLRSFALDCEGLPGVLGVACPNASPAALPPPPSRRAHTPPACTCPRQPLSALPSARLTLPSLPLLPLLSSWDPTPRSSSSWSSRSRWPAWTPSWRPPLSSTERRAPPAERPRPQASPPATGWCRLTALPLPPTRRLALGGPPPPAPTPCLTPPPPLPIQPPLTPQPKHPGSPLPLPHNRNRNPTRRQPC